jgi:hypothetical protein
MYLGGSRDSFDKLAATAKEAGVAAGHQLVGRCRAFLHAGRESGLD